jgi:hypothetical protein
MTVERNKELLTVCRTALKWAAERDYAGYNKHDGLNSPLLRVLSCNNRWLRIAFIQAVMRSPVNVRHLLGVRQVRNPKGISLFARAWLSLFRLTGDEGCRTEAERLLHWLLENPSTGFPGLSWGYHYPWQDLGFFAPPGFSNRIVTYFVGRALVDAFDVLSDERYLEAAEETVVFILSAPKVLYQDESMQCLSYVPRPDITMAVMDVSALCGALCAMVGKHTGNDDFTRQAGLLLQYVVDKQTDAGAWFYTHPPGDSRITHDNYHTGEIVDALRDYEIYSGDKSFNPAYHRGLDFYREHLFTKKLRPKWMYDQEYPYDIHGYAQGILTFTAAGEFDRAAGVLQSALDDMWNAREGRFFYQKHRFYTARFTLMRWCQAWMVHALSTFLASTREKGAR